ncbi:hypothetical protein NPIL_564421 [Nephila pilipes]|uniref:Uncharacterized protein n=1 Tax=Nephila pilipes TaxID=299642 RepID=A0A8X6PMF1_NEPPI|nr:hypothetical protein NPIL_564421 [Nephila pilipes]
MEDLCLCFEIQEQFKKVLSKLHDQSVRLRCKRIFNKKYWWGPFSIDLVNIEDNTALKSLKDILCEYLSHILKASGGEDVLRIMQEMVIIPSGMQISNSYLLGMTQTNGSHRLLELSRKPFALSTSCCDSCVYAECCHLLDLLRCPFVDTLEYLRVWQSVSQFICKHFAESCS